MEVQSPTVVGERLNPTGRKSLQEALKNENVDYAINLGLEQVNAGAQILGVNVGLPEIDEKKLMPKLIRDSSSSRYTFTS